MSDVSASGATHAQPRISFSVVSHGHGRFIDRLLGDLASLQLPSFEVLLTLNVPEDETFLARHSRLPIRILRDSRRKGFGENHNVAFRASMGALFAVVNPDVRLTGFDICPLASLLADENVGICAPAVYSSSQQLQDSARKFPTIVRLLRRKFRPQAGPDYELEGAPIRVDWVAGMFMLFRRSVFAQVGGFDERFFMYLEDVDICRRVTAAGWAVMLDPRVRIIHDAQRASRRNVRHIAWHLQSAVRYFIGR